MNRLWALRRPGFVVYALTLVTLTHWPALTLPEGSPPRSDLYIHTIAFGLWTGMLIATGWLGEPGSRRSIVLGLIVGAVYAAADELTQGIPVLRRYVALSDLLANWSGVLVACGAWLLIARWRRLYAQDQ